MKDLKEYFVDADLAKVLRELGYDEHTIGGYANGQKSHITIPRKSTTYLNWFGYQKYNAQNKHLDKAPLFEQMFDWFEKEFGLILKVGWIWADMEKMEEECWYFRVTYTPSKSKELINTKKQIINKMSLLYPTKDEARHAGIKEIINIIKSEQNEV